MEANNRILGNKVTESVEAKSKVSLW
jgi:hypothetical protein